jgi:hypothetical protein
MTAALAIAATAGLAALAHSCRRTSGSQASEASSPWSPGAPLWHGTIHDVEKLRLNLTHDTLWLTDERDVAWLYGSRGKAQSWMWKVHLKPKAKVLNLKDLSNPLIRELKEMVSGVRGFTWGPITDEMWSSFADFGIVEGYQWVPDFFKSHGVDGVWVDDQVASRKHRSVALFRLSAIESMAKSLVVAHQP